MNELNSQISEINRNKDQLADNNKRQEEAKKLLCEEKIKELELEVSGCRAGKTGGSEFQSFGFAD